MVGVSPIVKTPWLVFPLYGKDPFVGVFQASMLLTLTDHNPDVLSAHTKYHLLVCQADSCLQLQEYKKAEVSTPCYQCPGIHIEKLFV